MHVKEFNEGTHVPYKHGLGLQNGFWLIKVVCAVGVFVLLALLHKLHDREQ